MRGRPWWSGAALLSISIAIGAPARAQGVINFERLPSGATPTDNLVLFDQYHLSHGVLFYLDTDGDGLLEPDAHPRFEEQGDVGSFEAFLFDGPGQIDTAAPGFEPRLGQYFVARATTGGFEGLHIVYDPDPVSELSGELWDMDGCEGWEISAMGPNYLTDPDDVVDRQVVRAWNPGCGGTGTPNDLNGLPLTFAFDLPGPPSIYALRIQSTLAGTPGVAFDNFSPASATTHCDRGTQIIDFEPLAHPGTVESPGDHFQAGYRVSGTIDVPGPLSPYYCDSAMVSIIQPAGIRIDIRAANEPVAASATTPFTPISVDICELTIPEDEFEFKARKMDGSTVSVVFDLDDVFGAEHFFFPQPEFTDIVHLWTKSIFDGQVDNLTFCDGECAPPPFPMRAWWPGDECEVGGLALLGVSDRSGRRNHGAWVSGPLCGTGPDPFVGAGAMTFDGTAYVDVDPDGPLRSVGSGDFTLDAWVNATSPAGTQTILEQGGDPGYRFSLVLGSALQLIVCEGGSCTVTTSEDLAAVADLPTLGNGEWHHVSVTRDKGASPEVAFFLGGVPVQATVGVIPLPVGPLDELRIGDGQGPADGFIGGIDELQVFDRVVDPATLHRVAGATVAGKCKGDMDYVGFVGTPGSPGTGELALAVCNDCELGQPTTAESISIATAAGQSAGDLAEAFAAAINGSASLQNLGISATTEGERLRIHGGDILGGYLSDPALDLDFPAISPVPAMTFAALVGVAATLLLAGARSLRRRQDSRDR